MRLVLELPEELADLLGEDPGRQTLEALVMNLVRRGEVSRGRAAELLGLPVRDLPGVMERYGVAWVDLTSEELAAELRPLR